MSVSAVTLVTGALRNSSKYFLQNEKCQTAGLAKPSGSLLLFPVLDQVQK